ncbi:MAG: hypothetical protein ACI9NQ_001720, partial [Paracoccaceae bacterium]
KFNALTRGFAISAGNKHPYALRRFKPIALVSVIVFRLCSPDLLG